jgi:hypothetical protein
MTKGIVGLFLGVCIFVFLAISTIRIVAYIQYQQNCQGYLKQCADANTVELAKVRLGKALEYIEKNNWTSGYTSVIYRTPDEDVGFWYSNLKSSYAELVKVPETATQLETSNVLMKLRETLLDKGESSESVTAPEGISVYPKNALYGWLLVVSLIMGSIMGTILWAEIEYR